MPTSLREMPSDDKDGRGDEPADDAIGERAEHLLGRPVFHKAKEPPLQRAVRWYWV